MKLFTLITGAAALAAAAPAFAHEGPRIWIDNVAGRITTFTSDNDLDPTEYSPSRFFTSELQPFFGFYTTEFPGYEVKTIDHNVANSTTFAINIAGPLLYYRSAVNQFVTVKDMFGPPEAGPVPQVGIALGSTNLPTSDLPVIGFDFFQFNSLGDHAHLSYILLGDGTTAGGGPDGVYMLPLQLSGTSLATSKTYYLMLTKSAFAADVTAGTTIGQAISNAKPGDANGDGHVNITDLSILIGNNGRMGNVWWGSADFTADGKVNTADFNLLAGNYDTPGTFAGDLLSVQSSVPEPVFLPSLATCGYFLVRSRRRILDT